MSTIDPGPGYRILREDELPERGDDWTSSEWGAWFPVTNEESGRRWYNNIYRRRISFDIYRSGDPVSIIHLDGFDLPDRYGITTNTKARFRTTLKPILCVSNGEVVLRFEEWK